MFLVYNIIHTNIIPKNKRYENAGVYYFFKKYVQMAYGNQVHERSILYNMPSILISSLFQLRGFQFLHVLYNVFSPRVVILKGFLGLDDNISPIIKRSVYRNVSFARLIWNVMHTWSLMQKSVPFFVCHHLYLMLPPLSNSLIWVVKFRVCYPLFHSLQSLDAL
jgi:hypothetical protein